MPSAAAMARSSGVVMKPRTRSALAPTYTVVTVTDEFSLCGHCRTLSERYAWNPDMKITRLTTIARTGRRMKMWVNFPVGVGAQGGRRSGVPGRGSQLRVGSHRIVPDDRAAGPKLEDARPDDGLPLLEPRHHGDKVAPLDAEAHDLLPDDKLFRARGRVGLGLDHVHRVPVRRVEDGRRGNRQDLVGHRQLDGDVDEHSRVKDAPVVVDRG